ncbi:MAG: glycosyltransferase family 1 protein [Anaerolineales bacterium]|nr:glycosyltransferase family 1 protein [Anaerolineales bacterium]
MTKKMRLGLIVDPEFIILKKSVSAVTLPLISAMVQTFDTRIIYDQESYDRLCDEVDFLVSLEPRWAAPVLRWRRSGRLRLSLPRVPCYVMMSDPHSEQWRERYFLQQGLDYILGLYYYPTLHHFKNINPEQLVHFPWSIPDAWLARPPLVYRGAVAPDAKIMIFGASASDAYDVRNWCRQQPGVQSFEYSGVENKQLTDEQFYQWLGGFDAAIAAGSESPRYRLTTPKYFEIAGAGCLLFAQVTDDLERLGFQHHQNCLIFSQENFNELAREYLQAPTDPCWLEIRGNGLELIRSRHTQQVRLATLAEHVREWSGRR